jgi:hypothetical protein
MVSGHKAVVHFNFHEQLQRLQMVQPQEVDLEMAVVIQMQQCDLLRIPKIVRDIGGVDGNDGGLHPGGRFWFDFGHDAIEAIDAGLIVMLVRIHCYTIYKIIIC